MSAVIKTPTPFVYQKILMDALEERGVNPKLVDTDMVVKLAQRNRVQLGDIVTNRQDFYGHQVFRLENGEWHLLHDSSEMVCSKRQYTPVQKFLAELSEAYNHCYQVHLAELAEQERLRLEKERLERVEKTRQQTIEKAKSQGYSVKEKKLASGQIQLVLTRTV